MTSGSSNVTPATNSLVGWLIEPKFKAGCASLGYEEGNAGNTLQNLCTHVVYFCWSNKDSPSSAQHSSSLTQSQTEWIRLRLSHARSFGLQVAAHHLGNVASFSACHIQHKALERLAREHAEPPKSCTRVPILFPCHFFVWSCGSSTWVCVCVYVRVVSGQIKDFNQAQCGGFSMLSRLRPHHVI